MLTISRTKRVLGILINLITFNFLFVGNIVLLATKRTTLGGLVVGYKFSEEGSLVIYFFTLLLMNVGNYFTLGILWLVDVITMEKRDGTFAEKLADIKKIEA